MVKLLGDPLFLFFMVVIFGRVVMRRYASHRMRFLFLTLPMVLLWILSTPIVAWYLEKSLILLPSQNLIIESNKQIPQYIVVLSGGYITGTRTTEDSLSGESAQRVTVGVEWWKQVPSAKLIISGSSSHGWIRPQNRDNELMRIFASKSGAPKEILIEESKSTNTWDHPVQTLKLPGMTEHTVIGLVTSPWHLRRALFSFQRHFKNVIPYPYLAPPPQLFSFRECLPKIQALSRSAATSHEWMGLIWYRLRHFFRKNK